MTEPFHICEACRERIEPGARDVLEAVEMVKTTTFGGNDWTEGLRVFFHEDCYPHGSVRFKFV